MTIPSIEEMLKAGVHFGHQSSRWHPKMKPFIFTKRTGVHVIDLEQTRTILEDVLPQITAMAAAGKTILFVSTKAQAKAIVAEAAKGCDMPYITDRWVGGLLTNFAEIKKIFARYHKIKADQESGELEKYTKREQLDFVREAADIEDRLGGIVNLKKTPDVLFIPAFQNEKTAVVEANKMDIDIIGVCDTNANPDKAQIVIPANDDAIRSIDMITGLVRDAISEGRKQFEKAEAARGAAIAKANEDKKAPESKKRERSNAITEAA
jgi:small subunit ribosomal protein S2